MNRKKVWGIGFLGVTALAVVLEIVAAFDGFEDTVPWTDYIVTYIPGEVAAVAIGGLSLWLIVHFGRRYWRRSKEKM